MTRAVIALAIRTSIPASAWLAEPARYIETAFALLTEDDERNDRDDDDMSG